MKSLLFLALFLLAAGAAHAQAAPASGAPPASSAPAPASSPASPTPGSPAAPAAETPAPAGKLPSRVYAWDQIEASATPTATGKRRLVFDTPTDTLDKVHCHISTLNPGERSSAPILHLQEEIIIIKEGTIEATYDGKAVNAPAGSVIFFAANAVTSLRNVGTVPATYYVINYYPPKAAAPGR